MLSIIYDNFRAENVSHLLAFYYVKMNHSFLDLFSNKSKLLFGLQLSMIRNNLSKSDSPNEAEIT